MSVRLHLFWLGSAAGQFLAWAVLFVAITEGFFPVGGGIGGGVLTVFVGIAMGAILATFGMMLLARTYHSTGRTQSVILPAAGAFLAAMSMATLVILLLSEGPSLIVKVLRIYLWSPGGGLLPRDAAMLLIGAILSAVIALGANSAAGVVLARRRLQQGVGSLSQKSGGMLTVCWLAALGLGGASLLVLLGLVTASAFG